VTQGSRALVLAAGRVVATPALRAAAATAELVIAADGGLRHARSLGVRPDLLVGDLDSVDAGALRHWPEVARVTYPVDKDLLDLELALGEALARGTGDVLVVGALGDRLDQSLAAVAVAERFHVDGLNVVLDSGDARVVPLRRGQVRTEPLAAGTVFSLLATRRGTLVSLTGARWRLDHHPLEPGSGLGVSNVASDEGPRVTLHEGGCLVVVPRLPTPAAETIWGGRAARVRSGLARREPTLARLIERIAYAEVFERPGLDLRTRELLALAHLISLGDGGGLRTHVIGALRAGATPDELRELVVHAAMFVGFPRALAAADAVREVLGDPRPAAEPDE
jgi:thiamine pyrophosphokinase